MLTNIFLKDENFEEYYTFLTKLNKWFAKENETKGSSNSRVTKKLTLYQHVIVKYVRTGEINDEERPFKRGTISALDKNT
jgi:hypothetical protein